MNGPLPGPLGAPPDLPAVVATAIAGLLAWKGRVLFGALCRSPSKLALLLLAGAALFLSAGYVEHYLRGGPRIIDATSYWLQARALAEGHVTWPVDEPTASVRGRFLLMTGVPDSPRLGVIFPPGYPLVLAMGFLAGVPLWIGPIIGAFLVIATYALARCVTRREDVGILAAILSVICAALRYHTADTMAHGWAALLMTATLAFVYRAADAPPHRQLWIATFAGVAFGWLFATRPVSCLALLPILVLASRDLGVRARLVLGLTALVPAVLFLLEQRAVTGSFFRSSQAAYYSIADGPPGCFRYGFGQGIGCLHEHGDYVTSALPNGLGWTAALLTTLRRLRLHIIDAANAEPLIILAVVAPFLAFRAEKLPKLPTFRAGRIASLAAVVVLVVLAYVPFYFDGSYAGGGARLFADVLPVEHVLIASGLGLIIDRIRAPRAWLDFPRASAFTLALATGGFGVHAAYEHVALRDRDGGRPFFEPALLADAKIDHGLVFAGTDHGFNLAYDPAAHDAKREIVIAREYGDERDRMVWERLGHPVTHRYVFEGNSNSKPAIVPWTPGPLSSLYRFEAEAEWPPLSQSGGYFEPVFAHGTCAWGGRLLAIRATRDRAFQGSISFPVPFPGRFRVGVHVASRGDIAARFVLYRNALDPPVATWSSFGFRKDLFCSTLMEEEANLSTSGSLEVTARGSGELFLDAIALEVASPVEYPR